MKFLILIFLFTAGCARPPYRTTQIQTAPQQIPAISPPQTTTDTPISTAETPAIALAFASSSAKVPLAKTFTLENITFHTVLFDSRTHALKVADQIKGPGSIYTNAKDSTSAITNGLAAINAGFFTPEGKTLGFIVSENKTIGTPNTSSLGAGIYQNKFGKQSLIRRQSYSNKGVTEALQSGPFLVWKGKPTRGLSQERPRIRSILLTDGKTQWAIAQTSSTTLAKLGKVLATNTIGS